VSDVLVAGGGLAGAAAATHMARAGRAVTLIEREAGPKHKICGEFLSTEAQAYLARLGLDARCLGGAVITHVRLVRQDQVIAAPLPFRGIGLTRKTLDEALLAQAQAAGVNVRRGVAIRHIEGVEAGLADGAVLRPKTLFLATGKHDARGAPRLGWQSRLVGFKSYFRLAPAQQNALARHVELVQFQGGYAGLQMVEDGQANFCLLVEARLLRRLGGTWPDLLAHLQATSAHLAARFAGAVELLDAPLSIARVPYGYVQRGATPGLFRLGDQAAVIHSFTGDGMAIALHSAALAAQCCVAGQTSADYQRQLAGQVSGQIRRAGALYAAISAPVLGAALFASARMFPSLLGWSAAFTRVPPAARVSDIKPSHYGAPS